MGRKDGERNEETKNWIRRKREILLLCRIILISFSSNWIALFVGGQNKDTIGSVSYCSSYTVHLKFHITSNTKENKKEQNTSHSHTSEPAPDIHRQASYSPTDRIRLLKL